MQTAHPQPLPQAGGELKLEHLDVLIVGAGLSGIGQAYHLQTRCPDRSFAILEARDAMGGTWDLFRYPGVRSDSDMHTLGFAFNPWTEPKAIADGPSIRAYIEATAERFGIDRRIRYGIRVEAAAWSTDDARWTVSATRHGDEPLTLTCNFLCMCSGYYDYASGYTPEFPHAASFEGQIVHPQFWPEQLDHAGKRVVVIGSGATAVTLVPELAKHAAQVTMLQRSPTYIVAQPGEDAIANWLRKLLPTKLAYGTTRWKNVLLGMFFYRMARKRPEQTKERLINLIAEELGPDYDVGTHFTPSYKPWDQRVCLVPDADLFTAIRGGKADVVTDRIERFTPTGIRLASGKDLRADIIISATGLNLKLMSDIAFTIDGVPLELASRIQYKGMMFSDVPNLAYTFGYTNASWTLKADLVARYVCRLLNTMRKRGVRQVTPHNDDPTMETEPFVDFTSGYVQRAAAMLPKQGKRTPWRLNQNYARDVVTLGYGSVDDGMIFSNRPPKARAKSKSAA